MSFDFFDAGNDDRISELDIFRIIQFFCKEVNPRLDDYGAPIPVPQEYKTRHNLFENCLQSDVSVFLNYIKWMKQHDVDPNEGEEDMTRTERLKKDLEQNFRG